MTAIDVLVQVFAAGGKIVVSGSEKPRLLAPPRMRRLVEAHQDELRALLFATNSPGTFEVVFRANVFRRQISDDVIPLLTLPQAADHEGGCVSCGSAIEQGWRCGTCLAAVYTALELPVQEQT